MSAARAARRLRSASAEPSIAAAQLCTDRGTNCDVAIDAQACVDCA
jgi:hypothetical protein